MKPKKIKKATYSSAPYWCNNRQRAEFDNNKRARDQSESFSHLVQKMFGVHM